MDVTWRRLKNEKKKIMEMGRNLKTTWRRTGIDTPQLPAVEDKSANVKTDVREIVKGAENFYPESYSDQSE